MHTVIRAYFYTDDVQGCGRRKKKPSCFTSLLTSHSCWICRFFQDLEQRHNEQLMIRDISDIVQNYAAHNFEPYIVYCSNETFQQRTLQKLLWGAEHTPTRWYVSPAAQRDEQSFSPSVSPRNTNVSFKETLKQIESTGECGGLPMISFLILPMQRVTRLPLLLDVSLKSLLYCS